MLSYEKFHGNGTYDLKRKYWKGSIFIPTPGSNKGSKTTSQIELNMGFTCTKISIIAFLGSSFLLSYLGLYFYPNKDSTSFQPFLVVCKCAMT